jgi:protein-disulfide isomerase
MTKSELADYASENYGIELSTSNTKDAMIDTFLYEREQQTGAASKAVSHQQFDRLQTNMTYVAVILGLLMVVSLGYNVKVSNQLADLSPGEMEAPSGNNGNQPSGNDGNNAPSGNNGGSVDLSIDGDPVKGDEDAPVTIYEFSDFECPFCGRYYSQTYDQVVSEYVDTGQAKIVYKDFPLSQIHPNAQKASEAAECAQEQGQFWEFHDRLFENQDSLTLDNYVQWAGDLGMDTDSFRECVESGQFESEVQGDLQEGRNNGVSGTPTFFINGRKLVGAQPFSQFQSAIEAELE